MASTDARPVPKKNTAYRLYFIFRDNTGAIITAPTGLAASIVQDAGDWSALSAPSTATAAGLCYSDLTDVDMNCDAVTFTASCTNANSIPVIVYLYPEEVGDINTTTTGMADNVITAAALNEDAITEVTTAVETTLDPRFDNIDTVLVAIPTTNPTVEDIADAVWDEAITGHVPVASSVSDCIVGWWHFNENTGITTVDSSIYSNTGSLFGNETLPTWEVGKLNSSLDFHGDSYCSAEYSPSLNVTGSLTLEAWVNIHTDGDYKGIIVKNYSTSYSLSTGNSGDNAISFFYNEQQLYKAAAFILDTWHHVVATYDDETNKAVLYIDNIPVVTDLDFAPNAPGDEGVLGLGIQPYTDWSYVLDGSLDEVVIYNKALSAEEVAFRYNEGNGTETAIDPSPLIPTFGGNLQIAVTTPPTKDAIADQVWDETAADHTTSTTFGGKLQTAVTTPPTPSQDIIIP
jgi:hypothetical protein